MELAPRFVLLRYDDVPGVIGRVGTLFGEAGVNIANMAVSRNREGGQALMALSIDSPAPAELLEGLRAGVDDAYVIVSAMTTWPEPVERVSQVLRAAAVDSRVEEFADGTPTARAAAEAVGCELAQIVKSLVLRLRRRLRARARPRRPAGRRGCDRRGARCAGGPGREGRRGRARDRLRAGRRGAVPAARGHARR